MCQFVKGDTVPPFFVPVRYTTYIHNRPMTLTNISIKGKQFKVTRLRTAHGSASNRWCDRIKGGSSRVRTHGGAAGSSATRMNTTASALQDVR